MAPMGIKTNYCCGSFIYLQILVGNSNNNNKSFILIPIPGSTIQETRIN